VIHERDGQTDTQTLRNSKYRAYASHRAEKIKPHLGLPDSSYNVHDLMAFM